MKFSIASTLLASSVFVSTVSAHSRVWSLWVDGVDQGAGVDKYIREPPTNDPTKDLTSSNVFCNAAGSTAMPSTVSAAAGSTITAEWYHDSRGDDIIDSSHVGPIVAYLAPADATAGEAVWTKIYEDGYDGTTWAVLKLIANGGKVDFDIPASLAPGDYLLRVEILALHEADSLYSENSARGIQLYPSCSQLTVTGSGTVALPSTGAAFPGEYTDTTPGIQFSVYGTDLNTYVIPGPAVWDGTGDAAPASSTAAAATSTQVAAVSSTEAAVSSSEAAASSTAAAVTSTKAAVSSSAAAITSTKAAVSSTKAAVSSTVAAVSSTKAAVTSTKAAASSTVAVSTPTTSAATGTSTGIVDANSCMNDYNKCLAASQPSPDWTGCSATKDACMGHATYNFNMITRAKRDGKFGRLI